jgi:hypothetical protein
MACRRVKIKNIVVKPTTPPPPVKEEVKVVKDPSPTGTTTPTPPQPTITIEQKLKVGDTVRQRPGQPHQLEALTDGVVFEVSTEHKDTDSYRVWKGDSQK